MLTKTMSTAQIFLSFFKIGVIGFGGGSALIPVVEKELVQDNAVMDPDEYIKHTVIANITPGALPVKLGATCGYKIGGVGGSMAGAYGVMLPGALLTIIIMALFSIMGAGAIHYFHYASVGITAFIVFLLASYVVKTVKLGDKKVNILLCVWSVILTGGSELRHLLYQLTGLDDNFFGSPLFDISTINLMIVTFFMIIMLDKLHNRAELAGCFILCGLYSLCVGKSGQLHGFESFDGMLLGAMALVLCVGLIGRRNPSTGSTGIRIAGTAGTTVLMFMLVPFVLTIVVAAFRMLAQGQSIVEFITNICISTITSFGGGEAYISVAEGIFVQGGYVSPDIFYTQLVPVANALPGPILIKVASGMGYLFGLEQGSPIAGWAVAAVAATAAVGVCSAVAVLVMQLYDSISHSVFMKNLQQYILPVICGMLISTSMAMLYEGMKITSEKGIAGFISLPLMLGMVMVMNLLHNKYRLHDMLMLLGAAGLSLVALVII